MKIGSNIFSLVPQRQLSKTQAALSRSLERLSSGKRINSAKDDIAGLSMSIGLDLQIRGTTQAIRNANDGMSMLSVAEGAMNEMTNILQSIRELAVQAASGTLTSDQRGAINEQVQGLMAEYDRITKDTSFNAINLLNGTFGTRGLQIGVNSSSAIDLALDDFSKEAVFQKTVGNGAFQTRTTVSTGGWAHNVAVDDVNGDGILDLVNSVGSPDYLDVRLGRGDGTFRPSQTFKTGTDPMEVALADINGDGVEDIVTAALGQVDVLIGNGDGTFKPFVSYATSTDTGNARSVTTADVNGDEILDILTSVYDSNSVDVMIGNGDGTFKAKVSYAGGSASWDVQAADITGDGILDLVTAADDSKINVLIGNGDGTFQAKISYSADSNMRNVVLRDLNGDGILDITGAARGVNAIAVLLGNGDGTFKAKNTYTAGTAAWHVVLGDVNGDGILDAVTSDNIDGTVSVLQGNGDGSFKARTSYAGDADSYDVTLADLNGDGALDIISPRLTQPVVDIWMGNAHDVTAVAEMNLTSGEKASGALSVIDRALQSIGNGRAQFGVAQVRLEHAIDGLYRGRELLAEAYSNVVDADIAFETAELVRQQILRQAGIAMLSQANVMQARVLELLKI